MLMAAEFAITVEEASFSTTTNGRLTLNIPLDRKTLAEHFDGRGLVTLSVTGLLTNTQTFAGTDTIRIISK